jgi:dTDP-glucose pyrophosphorylase
MMNRTTMQELRVSPSDSLLNVLKIIDVGAEQIAIVLDEDGRLLGIVTDGDIRRALISGYSMDSPLDGFYTKEFKSVGVSYSREAALSLMAANRIEHLPIVDDEGRLHGLHLLSELVVIDEKPNWAVIMAGGRGSRLGALTDTIPKPMIKVAGRPILERIVLQLVGAGIRKIYLAVNYLSHLIEDHFGDGSDFGCQIEYLRETEPLGSGGALSLLPMEPKDPVIVMNGDLVTEFSLRGLLRTHERRNASITVGVRKYTHGVPFGCISEDGDLVTELREKPVLEELINTGIYAISPELIQRVPNEFYPITRLIEGALKKEEKVACFHIDEWIDVGQPHQLAQARGEE